MTLADKISTFNSTLDFDKPLPKGIQLMNPFKENPDILPVTRRFYNKFYNDSNERYFIAGINPGRHGAGVTGIPFTDSIRLENFCGIKLTGVHSYETSSEFVYRMIEAYGGVKKFYSVYYINAVCPLGFTQTSKQKKEVNYNYYDDKELNNTVYDFIIQSIKEQVSFGLSSKVCYCLGNGKNYKFLSRLNVEEKLFQEIIPLEHPRYIMQYKRKQIEKYIEKYLRLLK